MRLLRHFDRPLADASAEHTVPLWGIGLGNDFLKGNETYFSASSGWRPTRYFDVVSPFSPTFTPGHPSDPFTSLDFELGVHGAPAAVPDFGMMLASSGWTSIIEPRPRF